MINSGVININKPAGLTSHDVVSQIRRRLKIKRVGHTGTLDPIATGVLPICFGKATRIIEYYDHDFKTYEAGLQLGMVTDTMDITGETLEENDFSNIRRSDIENAVRSFTGDIEQLPPKYSALKQNGVPLYKLAREGRKIDIESKRRQVHVSSITVNDVDMNIGNVKITVSCSKGTYIRTICDDIGRKLGSGACMTSLCRTGSGCFFINEAIELGDILRMDDLELRNHIIPMEKTLVNLGKAVVAHGAVSDVLSGRAVRPEDFSVILEPDVADAYRIYSENAYQGDFLGVALIDEGGNLRIKKMLFEHE